MDDYIFELEKKWRDEQRRRDFGKEILELMTYEEAQLLLQSLFEHELIKKEYLDRRYKKVARTAKKQYAPGTFEYDFSIDAVWALTFLKDDLANKKQLEQLEHYWRFNELRKPTPHGTKLNSQLGFTHLLERAKTVPIETFIKSRLKRSGGQRLTCLCPFHDEKTPSFTIFTNTNTYCCFGCGAKGDVVNFYEKLYGTGFREAVKELAK